MKVNSIALCFLLAIFSSGCSVAGKNIYYEPVEQPNWTLRIHEPKQVYVPPMSQFTCGKNIISYNSSYAGEFIYSFGPIFIPVIPTFGIFNVQPGRDGVTINFTIKGISENPGLDINSLNIELGSNEKIVKADSFDKRYFADEWLYTFNFKSSFLTVDSFTVRLNIEMQECIIPSIIFEKKSHIFYCPACI